MTQYFFDVIDRGEFYRDSEGTDLPDLAGARAEALGALAEMARHRMVAHGQRLAVTVRTDEEPALFTASLTLRFDY